jgi:glycosyltransferase involved in cell wall biosynthesis
MNPELTEHFGISTVEAISAGCIPLVVGRGGQPEIVTNPDLLWQTIEELIEKTQAVINTPNKEKYLTALDISEYTQAKFAEHIKRLIS